MEARNYIAPEFEEDVIVEKPVATAMRLTTAVKPYQKYTSREEKMLAKQKREVIFFATVAGYGLAATLFMLLFLAVLPFLLAIPLGLAAPIGLTVAYRKFLHNYYVTVKEMILKKAE